MQQSNPAMEPDAVSYAPVDAIFSGFESNSSPGFALAILRDGKVVYKKGYGMANLEYGIPIRPNTVFHVASVSKQFTAFAIQLLASEGKLSVDDDVRKFVPELHEFEAVITINHLLHHTSGLRDQWSLLNLAGWRSEDVITEEDILGLVWRQSDLNFAPGAEELYSNTGYTLLGLIVKRISGCTLREFCEQRIFGPLGMKDTHFHDDNTEIVKRRAYCYNSDGAAGFRHAPLQYANTGATSLFTTVEDLSKWERNFAKPRVGDESVLASMVKQGALSSGKQINYASGLMVSKYRGLATVEHTGSDAGFRADFLRFPDQRFAVILLSNLGSVYPALLARKIADILLEGHFDEPSQQDESSNSGIPYDSRVCENVSGDYLIGSFWLFTFSWDAKGLWLKPSDGERMQVFPLSETEFCLKGAEVRFVFTFSEEGVAENMRLIDHGREMSGAKIVRTPELSPTNIAEYVGSYFSRELGVLYFVTCSEGKLQVRHPRGTEEMMPVQSDVFLTGGPIGRIGFVRDHVSNRIQGFNVTHSRVRNLRFERTNLEG